MPADYTTDYACPLSIVKIAQLLTRFSRDRIGPVGIPNVGARAAYMQGRALVAWQGWQERLDDDIIARNRKIGKRLPWATGTVSSKEEAQAFLAGAFLATFYGADLEDIKDEVQSLSSDQTID